MNIHIYTELKNNSVHIYHQDHLNLPTPAYQNKVLWVLLDNSIQTQSHLPLIKVSHAYPERIADASSKGSANPFSDSADKTGFFTF